MSLSKVEIKNFQSHKHSVLNLSPGVNVIVGTSDSGKSAIIRALKWVLYNQPLGDSFRSIWGGDTSVELTFEDEVKVTRYKSDKSNSYFLDKVRLDAIGTGVPETVKKYLRVEEINIQQQLDSPFLLSNSSGEVSSYLNRLIRLDKIDSSLSFVSSEIFNTKKEIEYKEREFEKVSQKLEEYKELDRIEQELEVLEEMEQVRKSKIKDSQHIQSTLQTIDKVQKEINNLQVLLQYEVEVNHLLELIGEQEDRKNKSQKLTRLIDQIQRTEEEQSKLNCIIKIEKEVNGLIEKREKWLSLKVIEESVESKIQQLTTLETMLERQETIVSTLEKEFWEKFPSVCPLCGTVIKE